MDSDFWASRLAAAKRQFNHHHHLTHGRAASQFDLEPDDEARPEYPCPYCFEEYDVPSLCSHLEADHSFESKPTVCSICSVKVNGDMITHINVQHGYTVKRRSRLRRIPFPNNQSLSLMGRDLREAHLQVLLGSNGYRSSNITAAPSTPDNLLSSLIFNIASETDDASKSFMSSFEESSSSHHIWKSSCFKSMSHEEREERLKQAVFVQDMLVSTLLSDQ